MALRILHLINSVNPLEGGTVECVAQIGGYLGSHGDNVEVVACGDRPDDPWVGKFPLKVHALGPGLGRYSYSPRVRPWLRQNIDRFDVLIVNGLWQYQGMSAYAELKRNKRPYFVYAHGMLDPWSRRAHPFRYVKKLAYWAVFAHRLLRDAEAVLFTSAEEAELAQGFFPVSSWKSRVVGNGISAPERVSADDIQKLQARFPELRGKRILVFLGRLHAKKGLDLLLQAFSELATANPGVHLLICGDGEPAYVERIKRLAGRLPNSKSVTWAGMVLGSEKWAALGAANLFVLPSHQENFGIAVAEALAAGTPVLISDKVNTWHEIVESGAGMVCSDNRDDLSKMLNQWLSLAPEALNAMKERARRCYIERFSVDVAAMNVRSAIAVAAASPGPAR